MAKDSKRSIAERLRVHGKFRLTDVDPGSTPGARDKDEALARVEHNLERIDAAQFNLFAEGTRSLLLLLQGMDTSGKDGVIRKVMRAFNPQGCSVASFKVPTAEEASHHFLWRIWKQVPARGDITIFNRSHYEDVLVVRVHDLVPKSVWSKRYEVINRFESDLADAGTTVLKFYLHISRAEQLQRLSDRLDDPTKHWKFSTGDLAERKHWKEYTRAYEDALTRCSTSHAPWYVIPSDRKWYRDLAVSEIVADTLVAMHARPRKVKLDLKAIRAQLAKC